MSTSEALTRGIRVQVRSIFVPERSNAELGRWFFAYTVRIANESDERAQLVSRHWIISDSHGREEEVQGPGVVGEQPVLDPGDAFEYTSACPLPTPFGTMRGTYQMMSSSGERFDVEIAAFALHEPFAVN